MKAHFPFPQTNGTLRLGAALLSTVIGGWLPAAEPVTVGEQVTVRFEKPEKFTDLKENSTDFENESGREHYLPLFRDYLVERARRVLAPGQALAITITDVDLAGDFEPWHGQRFDEIRVVKDLYSPRVNLRFRLTDGLGQVVKEGERRLVDTAFLMGGSRTNMDSLRYEKDLLDRWLRREFPRSKEAE